MPRLRSFPSPGAPAVTGTGIERSLFGIRLRAQTDDDTSPQNFNGTFTFGNIASYRESLLLQNQGDSPPRIRRRALGFGATQFSINTGVAGLAVHQMDAGIFAGDEWRVRPNFTLNLGLRYETQSNIHDYRDIVPRAAFAWAPGGTGGKRAKTVLRGGFGMFYDRFPLANTLTAERYNGEVQQNT